MYQRFISSFFYLKINSRFQKKESVTYENENSGRSKVGNISDINVFCQAIRLFTIKNPQMATRWSYTWNTI